jgi:hypothetical protein
VQSFAFYGTIMDTEAALYEVASAAVHTTEPFDGAASAPPKVHHFALYGQVSRSSLAAFAAAKIRFDSAVRRPSSYVVRFTIDEHADIAEAQSALGITVTVGPKRAGSGKMPGGAGDEGLPGHGTDFTAVNGSIIHCLRTSPD